MGVNIKDIVVKNEIMLGDLSGKAFTVDAFNILYQFLSTIRQRDGSLLTDSKGNVTSHLTGLFARTTRLMQNGIRLAFVFDGEPPVLKKKERERRARLKDDAHSRFKAAEKSEDIDGMRKYAARTSKLTKDMIDEAKALVKALGLPCIEAPSEGEAQAAHIVRKGEVYGCISQDYDNLLFGVPRMVQNLTISERRKVKSSLSYESFHPQMIELDEVLTKNMITREQLVAVGVLVGTDFDIGGIPGIGPKNAIKLVKQHGHDFDTLFSDQKWEEHFDYPYTDVMDVFLKMKVSDDYALSWKNPDLDKIKEILCENHDFSVDRVETTLKSLDEYKNNQKQKSLFDF